MGRWFRGLRNFAIFCAVLVLFAFAVRTAYRAAEFGYYFGAFAPLAAEGARKLEHRAARVLLAYEAGIVRAEQLHGELLDRKLIAQERESRSKAYSESQNLYVCDAARFSPEACADLARGVWEAEWEVYQAEIGITDARETLAAARRIAHRAGISTEFLDAFRAAPPRTEEERRAFTPRVTGVLQSLERDLEGSRREHAKRLAEREAARARHAACLADPPRRIDPAYLAKLKEENSFAHESFRHLAEDPCRDLRHRAEGGDRFIADGEKMLRYSGERLLRLRNLALQYGIEPVGQE